jgi:hypothetical protein
MPDTYRTYHDLLNDCRHTLSLLYIKKILEKPDRSITFTLKLLVDDPIPGEDHPIVQDTPRL